MSENAEYHIRALERLGLHYREVGFCKDCRFLHCQTIESGPFSSSDTFSILSCGRGAEVSYDHYCAAFEPALSRDKTCATECRHSNGPHEDPHFGCSKMDIDCRDPITVGFCQHYEDKIDV